MGPRAHQALTEKVTLCDLFPSSPDGAITRLRDRLSTAIFRSVCRDGAIMTRRQGRLGYGLFWTSLISSSTREPQLRATMPGGSLMSRKQHADITQAAPIAS